MGKMKAKPHSRDPERTRLLALDAAQRLFSAKGFAGTSMREIARASGVSQPLIHHHFGSKEGLYRAVKQRLVEGIRASLLFLQDSSGGAAGLCMLVHSLFASFRKNEDLLRLTAWSNLEGEATLWPGEQDIVDSMVDRLRHIQQEGQIRADIDPLLLTITIGALALFWCQNRSYYQSLFEEPLEKVDEQYLDQLVKVLTHGTIA